MKKIDLDYFYKRLIEINFKDKEYYQDHWHEGLLPIDSLIIAHTDIHGWIDVTDLKEMQYVDAWSKIKPVIQDKLISKDSLDKVPPIVAVKDNMRHGYRVWDGQLRVCSFIEHGIKQISAFVFDENL
ncbi:MAG TPA: hypothetical protein VL989_01510 [Candidatus Sulfotelmatobacter sp.]|nr:hypothetical protein [Candidatus Sulfotelmatobacter sp.]